MTELIMKVEPTVPNRPTGSWSVFCGLCTAPMKSSYRTRWHARRAAASHLWAHRSQGTLRERDRSLGPPPLSVHGRCPHPTKRRHMTIESAEAQIQSLRDAGQGSVNDNAYPCFCGYFHIGRGEELLDRKINTVLKTGSLKHRTADRRRRR